MREFLKQ